MDDFDKIIATAKVIARPESAVDEITSLRRQLDGEIVISEALRRDIELQKQMIVTLRKKLEIAVEALKCIPHNINHTKHGACHGCEMDTALAEIEKVKDE